MPRLAPPMRNLFSDIPGKPADPSNPADEIVEVIAQSPHVRIERIVSTGQASPEGFWYDQDEAEWVIVLQGEARLRFENQEPTLHMRRGDYVLIPPHTKHRVEWTTPAESTVWLAVYYS